MGDGLCMMAPKSVIIQIEIKWMGNHDIRFMCLYVIIKAAYCCPIIMKDNITVSKYIYTMIKVLYKDYLIFTHSLYKKKIESKLSHYGDTHQYKSKPLQCTT